MKKILSAWVLVLLATLLLLSACGRREEPLDIQALLGNDEEVAYIFTQAGMLADNTHLLTAENGGTYYPVQSEKYKTLADLTKLLESTYAQPETVAQFMGSTDRSGRTLYLEISGKLCRSSEATVAPAEPQADYDNITLGKESKGEAGQMQVSFSFLENGEDGSQSRCTMEAVKTKAGGWRLKTTRAAASRELLKAGSGQTDAAGVRAVAEQFLAALAAKDTAAIERLTNAQGGTYSYLDGCGVTAASITDTQEELDFEGEYLVSLTVSGGNGAFPEGENSFRLQVGYADYDSTLVVRQLSPAKLSPYNFLPQEQQQDVAANQLYHLMQLVGPVAFASPRELEPQLLAEYALLELSYANPQDMDGFTLEELQGAVKRYFGIEGFDPGTESHFYSADTKSYFFYGRGGASFNAYLLPQTDGNGVATLQVQLFQDPLRLKAAEKFNYTLKNNWDGSYTFVSGLVAG